MEMYFSPADICGQALLLVTIGTGLWMMIKWKRLEYRLDEDSMIEQLVPEIMTEVLSHLDYASLCSLSMTNSLMRKAANDNYTWKSLYYKDFWVEGENAVWNGWKGYYAETRAIVNLSAEFNNIIIARNISLMREIWLNADYVKCIEAPCYFISGYDKVMRHFERYFRFLVENNREHRDVEYNEFRGRVMKDIAWITVKVFLQGTPNPIRDSNVFEYHNGRWYLVLHQFSMD